MNININNIATQAFSQQNSNIAGSLNTTAKKMNPSLNINWQVEDTVSISSQNQMVNDRSLLKPTIQVNQENSAFSGSIRPDKNMAKSRLSETMENYTNKFPHNALSLYA